jgi:hypothetical protein
MPDLGPWVSIAELVAAVATLIATLMALGLVETPFTAKPAAKVAGVVTDAATGKPLPEASIQIIDNSSRVITAESVPDAKGSWSEAVKPGSYQVKAVCDGYRPAAKNVSVVEGKTRVVILAAAPQPQEAALSDAPVGNIRTIERVVVTGGSSGASAGSSLHKAADSDRGSTQAAPAVSSTDRQVERLLSEARKLNNADKPDEAVDKLVQASNVDPTDGRAYALAIKIRVSQGNFPDAKDLYADGVKYAKKHTDQVEQAGDLLK